MGCGHIPSTGQEKRGPIMNANLALYETTRNGLIPCKIVAYSDTVDYEVTVQITADRGPYRKGDRIVANTRRIVSRTTHTSNGILYVRPHDHMQSRYLLTGRRHMYWN
jgi:hypothetical protein